MDTTDVVIAGGGIIGLSTALELAAAGLRVTVIERGRAMQQASWAAAGMLAAGDPGNPAALRGLAGLSIGLYPEYLRRIERLSGINVPLRTAQALQSGAGSGLDVQRPNADDLSRLAPSLIKVGHDFCVLEEASLDPRDLVAALPVALAPAGVVLLEETEVVSTRTAGSGVEVKTSRGSHSAAAFVNCCGAWAGMLPSNAGRDELSVPVRPRKGQIASVRPTGDSVLGCVIRTSEIYLVPRGDGRVVIGATSEDAGFDKQVHPGAIRRLIETAAKIWPPAATAEVVESWAGLRPATPDELPIIGSAPGMSRQHHWIATGHFRNGILLAPATAAIMSQLIRGIAPGIDIERFRGERFTGTTAPSDNAAVCTL